MKKNSTLEVACVGAGYFSQFHIHAWRRIANVKLIALADPKVSPECSEGVAVFDSLSDLMKEHTPDVVDIITPPNSHLALIEEAVSYESVSVIICQKPFCESLEEAKKAVEVAKSASKTLVVHENFRFQPWYRFIKKQIESRVLGDVLQFTLRLRPGDGQGPNAYMARQPYFQTMPRFLIHETGVHYIDTFRYLLGEPLSLYADLRRLNPDIVGEDAGYVVFQYPNGVRALLDGNRLLDHAAENLRCTMAEALLEGTAGTLTLKGDGSVWHRQFHKEDAQCVFMPEATDQFGGDCAYELQAHVIDHLTNDVALENTAEDYLSVMEQESLVYQSSAEGRKITVARN